MDTPIWVYLLAGAIILPMLLLILAISQQGKRALKKLERTAVSPGRALVDDATLQDEAKDEQRNRATMIALVLGVGAAALGVGVSFLRMTENGPAMPNGPFEINAGELHGTMLLPRANAPVVLIVPGSGPTDRDGNNPLGVKANAYKLLAEGLAEEGIASVRVDKRGMFGSAAAGDPNAATVEKYVEDYHNWIDAVRKQTRRKCIFLLGHSEGALMVSAAAVGRKDVCGLILVSGMGRRMGDVLREQLKANPANAPLLDEAMAAIAEIEAGRHVDASAMNPALMPLFAPQVQDFLISAFAADPVDLVQQADIRTLIVQGTTDLQVTSEDARLLDKAPRTDLELIKGMNHVLKDAPADRAANLATYANPDLPLSDRLVREIEDFIKDND